LFEGARRALGPAMAIVATVFLAYVFWGSSELVPDVIRWKGASLRKAMSHMWITSEGVFGIALGVSTKFVFLFVLFGALLDKAGAGTYFIKMAFGALGHLRGGPAKAAVVGSAATGLISGSSIANVVTTGTFTIPLMKRVGFSSEQAGAVEVASSVNGQIMPPVMGAAAFLMVEYVGISYIEVITHAFLPATISYMALVYIVHIEAVKRNMPTLGNRTVNMGKTIGGMALFFAGFAALCYGVQFPVRLITSILPSSGLFLSALVAAVYVALLWFASKADDLVPDDPNAKEVELPVLSEIYKAGLHYLLPIIVLVYVLMIERKSPGLSAFWATSLLFLILLTQKPLKSMFRGESETANAFRSGIADLIQGLIDGARNMIGIGLATATAGVIVGTVTLTGVGQVMASLVEFLSGGNLILMLVMVGVLSLILGMGLPTTANYIVVSSLMAGVVVELGAQSGLIVPLIAV
ncbi:MAG: TRAP transporter fused permease subunit, partial [Boseongicola sp.]